MRDFQAKTILLSTKDISPEGEADLDAADIASVVEMD